MFTGIVLLSPSIKDNNYFLYFGKLIAKMIGAIFPTLKTVAVKKSVISLINKNPFIHE